MAGTSSWNDASTHLISEIEMDTFSFLENLSPVHDGLSELDLVFEQEIDSVFGVQEAFLEDAGHLPSETQEVLLEDAGHPQNKSPNQTTEPKKVVYRDDSYKDKLSREAIANCLHLTAREAAKFLGVGSRRFNERCRELGITRWPHRQFKSLSLAISNFQNLCNNPDNLDGELWREVIPLLESRKKLLQYVPSLPLEHRTKKLEKVAYNATYRRKKKNKISESSSSAVEGEHSLPCPMDSPDQEQ